MVRVWTGALSFLLFLSLLASCSKGDRSQLTDAQMRGHALFDVHCADCHNGTNPDLLKQPPRLHGLFMAKALPSGAPATDIEVRRTIIEGKGTMPAFDRRLQLQDIDDLLKYLHTL
jgi:mono/diheme cytochrome c family protein